MDEKDLKIQALLEEVAILKGINAEQAIQIEKLMLRILELEKRLGKNSNNSSKPPSSDGLNKPPRTGSLREKGKNLSGGQKGHKGVTLRQIENPDNIVCHKLKCCPHCNNALKGKAIGFLKRQVFDIPPVKIEVTEHQAEIKKCLCCNKEVHAEFPKGIDFSVQYGSRIKAQAVYFKEQHYIPEDRLQTVFRDLYGVQIATSTLVKFSNDLYEKLNAFDDLLLNEVKKADVKHMDETGFRIGGKTQWLHVASNEKVTYYHASPHRKSLLNGVTGIIVHDHWKPYYQMPKVEHALCNAHHLRELQALIEHEKEAWARKMQTLLRFMCKYRYFFAENIPPEKIQRLEKIYDRIIEEGLTYHDSKRKNLTDCGVYTKKRYAGHNLLLRLKSCRCDVLRFLRNPDVPFTNNQAERDIRMMKLKQKISGGFRTTKGAEVFIRIRAFISTARKQGWDVFNKIFAAIEGDIPVVLN